MKKILTKIVMGTLCLSSVLAAASCGKKISLGSDGKVIVVSVYNGGLGTDWIDPIVADFEADYPEYKVQVDKTKKPTVAEIENYIALGSQADLYINTVSDFHKLIYSDKLEDMSDVLEMKPDGEDGLTVAEKFSDLDTWKTVGSKDGKGFYMIPYDDLILGFNYDHGKFVELGLMWEAEANEGTKSALTAQGISYREEGGKLIFASSTGVTNYKDGDVILRAGKDGKYGTYDDGQPITMAEWNTLVNNLKSYGKAFIYAGGVVDYTTDIFNGIFAQYDGVEAWNTFVTYDGEYTFAGDSEPTTITMENGYKVFGMQGIYESTKFMQTYLNDKTNYAHASCFATEVSHTDAQGKYIIGGAKDSTDAPFTGILVDGVWWEREANGIFRDLSADARYKDYAYGTRDYRIMLFPEIEGQKGVDGNGNGTVLSARSTGACIIPKQDNRDIVEKTKIFLSYTLKEEHLRNFTAVTGGIRPYKYDLTEADKAKMTKYASNVWELYHDDENIAVVRPLLDRYLTALPYKTSKGINVNWYTQVGSVAYNIPLNGLRQAKNAGMDDETAIQTTFNGFEAYYQKAWPNYINELNR